MSKNQIVSLVLAILFGLCIIVGVSMYFSYNNTEIALRKEAEAQRAKVEGVYDKMWKIISQEAQISAQYKNDFKEIYPELMKGRYGEGENRSGSFMLWIQEHNPNFDTSLYKHLMTSIEVYRTEFQNAQERIVDIQREHETLCKTYPGTWFISNKTPIEYTVISSTKSKYVVETGLDDDVELFNKN